LQMGNDELIKKVFIQARKFMKYNCEISWLCGQRLCYQW
jgi:hypothetical protein